MFKKILLTAGLLIGCFLFIWGQDDDKKPPKPKGPVVPVENKKTPTPKPTPTKPN